MKLLLLSNSSNYGEAYLEYPKANISNFLEGIKEVLFVPYAAVTFSYDDYCASVNKALQPIGVQVKGIHNVDDKKVAVENAEAIAVGGGNTFQLLTSLYKYGLVDLIHQKVKAGLPYIGWSAGSNMACPTICTTNDMPIVEPPSFKSLNLVPFQINPHFTDAVLPNHNGESRSQRLKEFLAVNQDKYVTCMPEGTLLRIEGSKIDLVGSKPMKVVKYGMESKEYNAGEDISFLLNSN